MRRPGQDGIAALCLCQGWKAGRGRLLPGLWLPSLRNASASAIASASLLRVMRREVSTSSMVDHFFPLKMPLLLQLHVDVGLVTTGGGLVSPQHEPSPPFCFALLLSSSSL